MSYAIGENCTGCTACGRNCPVFAISGEKGTRHEINPLRCVECGVCGRVCPASAVSDLGGKICAPVQRSLWSKPKIKFDETVKPGFCSACGICVQDCGRRALSISMPRFRGDIHVYAELSAPLKCVACGICERHCPLRAVTMVPPNETGEAVK